MKQTRDDKGQEDQHKKENDAVAFQADDGPSLVVAVIVGIIVVLSSSKSSRDGRFGTAKSQANRGH